MREWAGVSFELSELPENFNLLRAGQHEMYALSVKEIEGDEHLSRHMATAHVCMDFLVRFCMRNRADETEDEQAVRLLGMRTFNSLAAGFDQFCSGYYQVAGMILRDVLETAFLLSYFNLKPDEISVWRTADDKIRRKHFRPSRIRDELDKANAFEGKRRAKAYTDWCELAVHPTPRGFVMLAPFGGAHQCGPFFDSGALKTFVEEEVKLAIQAANNFAPFAFDTGPEDRLAKVALMEATMSWAEVYFGRPFDRAQVDELRILIAEAARRSDEAGEE